MKVVNNMAPKTGRLVGIILMATGVPIDLIYWTTPDHFGLPFGRIFFTPILIGLILVLYYQDRMKTKEVAK